jgi:hypothetical protein
MSLNTEYQLRDLRRVDFQSWLNIFLSLGQRVRDIVPLFGSEGVGSYQEPEDDARTTGPTLHSQKRHHHQQETAGADAGSRADTPDMLSAAIEVKFLLPLHRHSTEEDHDHGESKCSQDSDFLNWQAHESVASTIAAVGQRSVALHNILATGHQERDVWDTHWIVKTANSAQPTPAEEAQGKSYHWVPVEVCSPKQRLDKLDSEISLRTISAVLRALRARHRVVINYTCDVHVHVGRIDGRALSLTTLKRLATMLWLSEDMLRSVRDPSSPNFRNVFTWGAEMRHYSRLAMMTRHGIDGWDASMPGSLRHIMRNMRSHSTESRQCTSAVTAIWQATSHVELGRLLSGPTRQYRRLGFNFSSLGEEDDRARTGPKTVEFRVLDGTLDEDVICAWVMICWKLVAVAGDVRDGGSFMKVVKHCLVNAGDDMRGASELDRDGHVLRGWARDVMVGCLGIKGGVYDAFVEALMQGREKQGRGVVG